VSNKFIPYGRQFIDEEDIRSVVEVLKSDFLTTGPRVEQFERALAEYIGTEHAVVFSSGTAALHGAMYALDIGPDDEVIVPAITFAATANCVLFLGGKPVFADVQPGTLLMDPEDVSRKITPRTKAIIAVDYAGHPCDYIRLRDIADNMSLSLVADCCHSLGAKYRGVDCGSIADISVFSFHPVKHITTGEGGCITTDREDYAERARRFRNHGITADHRRRAEQGTWFYEIVDIGYNYRITDFQCALGISQLKKLPQFLDRRRGIAARYDEAFRSIPGIEPLKVEGDILHAYHLYVVRILKELCGRDRLHVFNSLKEANIGANVHYIPVHLHPFYRKHFGTGPGQCPAAEEAYDQIISLPIHPGMSDEDVARVIQSLEDCL
jgi:perosamine synthetase